MIKLSESEQKEKDKLYQLLLDDLHNGTTNMTKEQFVRHNVLELKQYHNTCITYECSQYKKYTGNDNELNCHYCGTQLFKYPT